LLRRRARTLEQAFEPNLIYIYHEWCDDYFSCSRIHNYYMQEQRAYHRQVRLIVAALSYTTCIRDAGEKEGDAEYEAYILIKGGGLVAVYRTKSASDGSFLRVQHINRLHWIRQ